MSQRIEPMKKPTKKRRPLSIEDKKQHKHLRQLRQQGRGRSEQHMVDDGVYA